MPNVGTVTFDVAAESAKLRSELDKVKKEVGGLSATARNFESGLKKIGGVLIGAFSIGAVAGFARHVTQAADRLQDLSQRLGVTASRLNVIELAATQAGASADAVATAMAKLTENVGAAATVNKSAAAAIETLGLSTAELLKLRPDQTFETITVALSRMPNEYQRAAVAQDLFGRGAKELAGFYREGVSAIDAVEQALQRHGAALSDIDIARVGVMNDDLVLQGKIIDNLGIKFVSSFSPAIEVAIGSMSTVIGTVGGATEAGRTMGVVFVGVIKIIETAANLIMAAFETVRSIVATVIGAVMTGLEKLVGGFAFVAEKLGLDVAQSLRATQEGISGIAESMFAVGESAGENAKRAGSAALKSAADFLNAGQIFDQAATRLEERAAAAAARAPGGGELRPGAAGEAGSRILSQEALGGTGVSGSVRVEGPNEFQFEQTLKTIYDRNLERMKEAGVLRQQEWERQLNDMGVSLGNSIAYQTGLEAAKYETWGSLAGQFVGVIGGSNKRMAKLQQSMAIAQAIWWTASGVANALRSVPFPANIAAAAKVAVMGALQIAKIRAARYSESGSVSGGSFGGLGGGGGAEAGGEGTFGTPIGLQQQEPQRMAQIIIHGNVFSSQETAQYLLEVLSEAINDRDVVVISGDSRQALELGAT